MRPMLAEPVFIGLVMIAMLALFLMTVITVVIGLVVYLSRQNSPQKAAAPGVPVPPAFAKTQVMPRQCPQCGAQLKPDAPEGLCPACLLKRGLATEGGAPSGAPTFVPPPIPELAVLFPQLEIIECLGRGGMGAVYKTRQPRLDRFEALKILAPEKQNDAQFAERFEREARALARLNHPNIVTVYGFGEVQGRFYLLMEFVDGLTLRQVLQGGKMTPTEALKIVPKICDALQYAHEQGIVHRDIKPENILLDKQGRVKIADFGIAKIAGLEPRDLSLTGVKDVMGTPHYMAPEQVEQPQSVDHRADIYSLGVVFYEMLTGELPLGKFAPPSEKAPLDTRLDDVVMHSLEKEPARRYQQASQVKTDVETIAGTPGAVSASKPAAAPAPPAPPITPATISPVATTMHNVSEKTILPAFLLAFFFGVFGAHRFYAGKMITACLQLGGFIGWILLIIACATTGATWQPELGISLGFLIVGCGIWSTIDWILIVCKAFTDGQGRRIIYWVSPQGGISAGNSAPINPPPAAVVPATGNHAMITAPAVCLLVVGIWKILSALSGLIFFGTGSTWHAFVPLPPELGNIVPMAIISSLFFQLVPGILIIIGGYQMLHRRSYGWAMAGGILSLLACSLIGLPVGIWTMIVLAREDVRAAFNDPASPRTNSLPGQSGWHPAVIVGGGILILLLLLLIAAISLLHIPSVRADSIGRELDSSALKSAGIRQDSGEYKKDFAQSFPLAADGRFSLDNVNGQTEIHGWNSNTVSVQAVIHGQSSAYVNAVRIDADASADQVTIHTITPKSNGFSWSWFIGNWNNNADVDYIVYAPEHAVLDKIQSVNGGIEINGVAGAINTSTVNGQIQIKDAADDLKASTVNGQIAITMTALGHDHHVSLDAVNGQLELTLPADADATFSANTVNGSMNSEFPGLEVQHEFPVGSKLNGTLGQGSASVKATTVNGGFRIKKQSAP